MYNFVAARRLNEYIRHYETLSYPVEEVHRSHLRAKRSINRDSTVTLKFRAHGKDFHIRLKRDLTTFSNNLIIEGSTGERQYDCDVSHVYQGNLVGMYHDKNIYSLNRNQWNFTDFGAILITISISDISCLSVIIHWFRFVKVLLS